MRRDKLLLFGGITTERARHDHTATSATTRTALRFCDSVPPFRTTFKMSAAYQLPWEFQLSGSFIATPGPSVDANYTVTRGDRRPADHRHHGRRARRSAST